MKHRLEAIPGNKSEPLRQHVMHGYVHQRYQKNSRPDQTPFQACRFPAQDIPHIACRGISRNSPAATAFSRATAAPGICRSSPIACLFYCFHNLLCCQQLLIILYLHTAGQKIDHGILTPRQTVCRLLHPGRTG